MLGLGIAWWRSRAANLQAQAALEQSELARRDHITELFNRAIGQLGDDKLEVRLGAVYTLWAICQDRRFQSYTWPIVETLSAYVRERSLAGSLFRRTDLSRANLARAILSKANMQGAILRGASLVGTLLDNADLRGADLGGALNVSADQLREAVVDASTTLPLGLELN